MSRAAAQLLGCYEGPDAAGVTRRVSIYKVGRAFRMVDWNSERHPVHPSRRSIPDVGREVHLVLGISDPVWKPTL